MAQYQYSFQGSEEKTAKAVGRDLPISFKQSIELCAFIRHRPVKQALHLLQDAIDLKQPIPFKRFVNGYGHKSGMGPGRYVPTAAKNILQTINHAVKNAQQKNLGTELIIIHATAQQGSRSFHYGRQSRQKEKKTHVEIVVAPAQEKIAERSVNTRTRASKKKQAS